jgi:hypothetical protein
MYTMWDKLSIETISRYCPFQAWNHNVRRERQLTCRHANKHQRIRTWLWSWDTKAWENHLAVNSTYLTFITEKSFLFYLSIFVSSIIRTIIMHSLARSLFLPIRYVDGDEERNIFFVFLVVLFKCERNWPFKILMTQSQK